MKYSIIGGDLRLAKLANLLLDEENEVFIYGMEELNEINQNSKIIKCKSVEEAIDKGKIIICSIPLSNGNEEINAAFSLKKIHITDLVRKKHNEKVFIAGNIKQREIFEESYGRVIDLMENETLTILNTIATAEGTIKEAIENTEKNLQGSNILVLGFGRVAKTVANKLKKLDCNVTCAARKKEDLAWIKTYEYRAMNIYNLHSNLNQFDIIINTIPKMIIDKTKMQFMKKDVLLIDLASKPGGISLDDAKEMNLKTICAQGLPGKVAPLSSAQFIKQAIKETLF